MKTLASVVDEAANCHAVLLRNSLHDAAAHLQALIEGIAKAPRGERSRRLRDLASCCHPRAWGDLDVEDISITDWLNRLGRLEASALMAIAEIEKEKNA